MQTLDFKPTRDGVTARLGSPGQGPKTGKSKGK
jgi:hypothetical protein